MKPQSKVKLIITIAIIALIALFALVVTQLVFIAKTKKELQTQQKQIDELNKKLDYYENKYPNEDGYDIELTGESLWL